MTATVMRKAEEPMVLPFDDRIWENHRLNAEDSVMTLTEQIGQMGGGGTACALPLMYLLEKNIKADTVIFVSDNESWQDSPGWVGWARRMGSEANERLPLLSQAWEKYTRFHPAAKIVKIDIVPNTTVQAETGERTLNIGGFSDHVFNVVSDFLENDGDPDAWVNHVRGIQLPQ